MHPLTEKYQDIMKRAKLGAALAREGIRYDQERQESRVVWVPLVGFLATIALMMGVTYYLITVF